LWAAALEPNPLSQPIAFCNQKKGLGNLVRNDFLIDNPLGLGGRQENNFRRAWA